MIKRGKVINFLALTQISIIVLFMFSFASIVSGAAHTGQVDDEAAAAAAAAAAEEEAAAAAAAAEQVDDAVASYEFHPDTDVNNAPAISLIGTKTDARFYANELTGELIVKDAAGKVIENPIDLAKLNGARTEGLKLFDSQGNLLRTFGSEADKAAFLKAAGGQGILVTPTERFEVLGVGFTGGVAHLVQGAVWAIAVVGAIQLVGGLFGLESELTKALSLSAIAGIMSYKGLDSLGPSGFGLIENPNNFFLQNSGLIGIGVGVAVFLATYKKEKQKIVQFQCLPWEAPNGGSNCEACNEDEFRPCSEYRCRSLGQACELVNEGTKEEACVWVSPQDVTSPTITPWGEPLTDGLSYTNHGTRPPSLGTKIIRNGATNGCLQAFTPLEFGIQTNEPAQCKIDYVHTDSLDNMVFFFGESNFYIEDHEQRLSLPSPDSLNAEAISLDVPEFQNDGVYDLYVRCQDANGNQNVDEFVFNFCVDSSPDTTPPIIVDTSIISGSPVTFEAGEAEISAFINEPAECKWSIQDKDYDSMENEFACSTSVTELNAQQLYECSTTLTGIKDREENTYYFRCKDQPSKPDSERNVNAQSFVFTLQGTEPLDIIDVSPNNETISDSTNVVDVDIEVETSNGANEGKAICYFSDTGEEGSFVQMFETDNFAHRQTLTLNPFLEPSSPIQLTFGPQSPKEVQTFALSCSQPSSRQ